MKSLMLFLRVMLEDIEHWCCTSTTRDYQTIARRVEHEGVSFLTITLPAFGKELEKALDQGSVGPAMFAGFTRHGALPRFLGGLLDLVFDRTTGLLLQEPSVEAIRSLRQVTQAFGKLLLPCTERRTREAFDKYLECEKDVRQADATTDPEILDRYRRVGRMLWADLFSRLDASVYDGSILPKHGPGATADRLVGNDKWQQIEWTERLEAVFPAGEYLLPSPRYHQEYLANLRILEPGAERPVRVISVPKTLKTPRIIAVEPTCMQYMQQGLLAAYEAELQRNDILLELVGSASQVPNQRLAKRGSENGTLATLDLSEASDRVSNQHVRVLLENHPWLARAVDASRSRKADVPGHGVIRLAKFASMGSGLTFAMESVVFLTLVITAIESDLNRPVTYRDVRNLVGKVRIYGDDIIVPVEHVPSVVRHLEAFGLKVNLNKSFWTGKFRESCGKEYYAGQDVTLVKVRRLLPPDGRRAEDLVSAVSLRNQCYKAGLWKTARYLDTVLGKYLPMPMVLETSPILGRISALGYETQKTDRYLHRPLVKGLRVAPRIPVSKLDGVPALMKVLLQSQSSDKPNPDEQHLMRAGRPKSTNTKLGWGPPF